MALGESALSQGSNLTVGHGGFYLLLAYQLSSKVKVYTNICFLQPPPGPETVSKSDLRQRPSDWVTRQC